MTRKASFPYYRCNLIIGEIAEFVAVYDSIENTKDLIKVFENTKQLSGCDRLVSHDDMTVT